MTDANVVLGYIAPGPLASGALTVSRELAEQAVGALGDEARPLDARGGARDPRARERGDDARAPRRVDREGPRPGRLRARRLRRLRPGARRRARSRAGRAHRDRAAARGALLGGRPAVRAARVPRRPLLPRQRARARPRRAAAARRRDARGARTPVRRRARVATLCRRPLPGPELERADRAARRARCRGDRHARRALRGRARAALRHPPRPRLAGRHPRAAPRRARPGTRAVRAAGGRARRRAARGAPTSGRPMARSTRRSSRARRSAGEASPGPLLVDEYDTTVVVPPGWTVRLDPASHALVLDLVAAPVSGRARGRDRDAARRQRARDRRRRDGDRDLPHCPLSGSARRDGLLGRAVRRERRDGGAGGHDPAAARLDPERDADAARALRRTLRAGRRVHRQRPVRRREPHARRLRRQAVVRRRAR